jgi:hypothetical protein
LVLEIRYAMDMLSASSVKKGPHEAMGRHTDWCNVVSERKSMTFATGTH